MNGLNRVDDDCDRLGFLSFGDDPLDRCLGEKADVLVRGAQAVGAKGDLSRRFFARDVEHGASPRELVSNLQQQRRFSDAWLSADESNSAKYQSSAQYAIESGDRCRHPRRFVLV